MEATILMVLGIAMTFVIVATPTSMGARRRRRRSTAAALDWIRAIRVPAATFAAARAHRVAAPGAGVGDTLCERMLRHRVRVLEEALLREQHSTAGGATEPDLQTYRRQVSTVMRALSANAESSELSLALARMSSAVARLDANEPFARPALTVAQSRSSAPAWGTTEDADVVSHLARGTVTVPAAAADSLAPAASGAERIAVPEVVLPVPPLAKAGSTRRSRGWFVRGRAA